MQCDCGITARKPRTPLGDPETYWECNDCGWSICCIPCSCCVNGKIEALKSGQSRLAEFKRIMGKYLTKELEEELKEHL
tara:strand:- start:1933 stop:2169 length:237 start_codon:yes stop_codon:yes gene_type:complete